jgi:hypothetical protein
MWIGAEKTRTVVRNDAVTRNGGNLDATVADDSRQNGVLDTLRLVFSSTAPQHVLARARASISLRVRHEKNNIRYKQEDHQLSDERSSGGQAYANPWTPGDANEQDDDLVAKKLAYMMRQGF